MPVDAIERFFSKIRIDDSGCWIWGAYKDPNGYGRFGVGGKTVLAHRYSYNLKHPGMADGKMLDHRCRNTSCVNPEHLQVATYKENNENLNGAQSNNKLGIRGVGWDDSRRKYYAKVTHNYRTYNLGRFDKVEDAERAAIEKRQELFTNSLMDNAKGWGE